MKNKERLLLVTATKHLKLPLHLFHVQYLQYNLLGRLVEGWEEGGKGAGGGWDFLGGLDTRILLDPVSVARNTHKSTRIGGQAVLIGEGGQANEDSLEAHNTNEASSLITGTEGTLSTINGTEVVLEEVGQMRISLGALLVSCNTFEAHHELLGEWTSWSGEAKSIEATFLIGKRYLGISGLRQSNGLDVRTGIEGLGQSDDANVVVQRIGIELLMNNGMCRS